MANEPADKNSPKNRRINPRRKPRGYVRLECRKGSIGLGPNVASTLLDVSETGARFVVSLELPVQKEVEVCFSAPGIQKPIKRLGLIRWQVKLADGTFCIGVEFDKRIEYRDLQNMASPS